MTATTFDERLARVDAGEPLSAAEIRELSAAPTIQLHPRVPDTSLTQLDQLMEREPERVAAQVKNWMSQD